jgi:hypothetical protein
MDKFGLFYFNVHGNPGVLVCRIERECEREVKKRIFAPPLIMIAEDANTQSLL